MTFVMIRQPGYLPNIGFFNKIQSSDVFIHLDDAQYAKDRFDNRNKIRTKDGFEWLTVPLKRPVFGKKLNEVLISYSNDWQKNHLNLIFENYQKTDYFSSYWNSIEHLIKKKHKKLINLNFELINFIINELKISTTIKLSSNFNTKKLKTEKLLELCNHVNTTTYISGISGKDYLDEKLFSNSGIKVVYENFIHPIYNQFHGEFIEHMSIIDLLFNVGENSSKNLSDCKNIS